MDIYASAAARIAAVLAAMQKDGELPETVALPEPGAEPARDPAHGEIASNAALALAKSAGMKPRDIAARIAARLAEQPGIARVEVAGPGFLNITLEPAVWYAAVRTILAEGDRYGAAGIGGGRPTNVEYVSANPTGPMHVGHGRGAVFGDALANLLAFAGYDVTREYYVNDAGGQIGILARSVWLRYLEALGKDIGEIPAGLYPGEYLKPVGEALVRTHGRKLLRMKQEKRLAIVRDAAVEAMLAGIKDDLAALNIRHDVFFSEKSLTGGGEDKIKAAIGALAAKGLIYEGRLPKPKGHDGEDWEDREQTLFRSTQFGDDTDRALVKSDGGYTYFAGDIAYHYDKLRRGFTLLINVFGADHVGYIPRMKAAVAALSDGQAEFDIKVVQLVNLFRAGEPVRMSKRAGTFVTLREVVDEVGRDPVRFMMLTRRNDAPLDFDLAKVVEHSKDNPVFYVQYAHARTASVFRNAEEVFPDLSEDSPLLRSAGLAVLSSPYEMALIRTLALFPSTAAGAARSHEPHRLAFYLQELASLFHTLWTKGSESPHLRFIHPDSKDLTAARLALAAAVKKVLSLGLRLLGVEAPDVMH